MSSCRLSLMLRAGAFGFVGASALGGMIAGWLGAAGGVLGALWWHRSQSCALPRRSREVTAARDEVDPSPLRR